MFNPKWGFVCGGAAFVLAFIISLLLGHTILLVALARAAGFAALFFCLGAGIWALITIFIPELLNVQDNAADNVFSRRATGARVNITLDDASDSAFSAALPGAADNDEVGDFKDLVSRSTKPSRDIDQSPATGYTEEGEQEESAPVFDNSLGASLDNSLDSVKIEGLGDFSMDFGAFVPEGGKGGGADPFMDPFSFLAGSGDSMSKEESPPPPPRKSSADKTSQLQGDFDPREIAAGIRTVLEKDKKG
ncbi:MAG: hypothetical protein LBB89_06785 [Treponema sp.]|jgi:hypothetical protein|nr:hypothetical protein [Treponema sp.]